MFQTRIMQMFADKGAAHRLSATEGLNLVTVRDKMNQRIATILNEDGGRKGLEDIFKFKSQVVDEETGQRICVGGPLAFFRFLFDFAVPSKVIIAGKKQDVSLRTGILEQPAPGGASGQCWKVYGDEVKTTDYTPDPYPRWNSGEQMHCYICDIPLTLEASGGNPDVAKKNMQCEHLFPFTEGQLFWILYSNAIDSTAGYTPTLRNIQRREYAPVCQDCNCRLKSSVGILKLNDEWMSAATAGAREGLDIVEIDDNSIQKIACKRGWDNVIWQQRGDAAYDRRYNRLLEVFGPLVKAINDSLTNRGINTPKELSQFLIYKYLSYFDDKVMEKLKIIFIGGESMKKNN